MEKDDESIYEVASVCKTLFRTHRRKEPPSVIDILLEDYEQRFLAWSAYMGVFASKSLCLDRRLQDRPGIRDLVIRLLDILVEALEEVTSNNEPHQNQTLSEPELPLGNKSEIDDLTEDIETSLVSLSRLGTTIRKYSTTGRTAKIRKFAEQSASLKAFEKLARVAVDTLYMEAKDTLRAQLTRSMVETCASILYKKSHQHKMNTNRPTRDIPMPTIREERDDNLANSTEGFNIDDPIVQILSDSAPKLNKLRPYVPLESTPSVLDSLRTTVLKDLGRSSKVKSNCSASSIQLGKVSYPRASGGKDASSYRACEWCLEKHPPALFDNKKQWSAHLDKDFEPYVCLSESCMAEIQLPSFATFKEWFNHMNTLHTVRWQQEIHRPIFWVCNFNHKNEYFSNQEELHEHMKQCYPKTLVAGLPAIVKNSHTKRSRSHNVCPLCCRDLVQDKRRKRRGRNSDRKRRKVEGNQDNVQTTDAATEYDSSSSDEREESKGVVMARHIAEHLQISMFLTMRLINCQQMQQDGLLESEEITAVNTSDRSTLTSELPWPSQASEVIQPDRTTDEIADPQRLDEREQAHSTDPGIIGAGGNNAVETTSTLGFSDLKKYTIGWICDSSVGLKIARHILDEGDDNKILSGTTLASSYFLGRIGEHYIAVSGVTSENSPSLIPIMERVTTLLSNFPSIKVLLLVGVGHRMRNSENVVRCGDIVVGVSDHTGSSLVQYDLEESIKGKFFPRQMASNNHPASLNRALKFVRNQGDRFTYNFKNEFNEASLKQRELGIVLDKSIDDVSIHYGLIASGTFDISEAPTLDMLAADNRILCFDNDAAGLMNGLSCLVIRSIYDHSDFYTDPNFAALLAAIFTKVLLLEVSPAEVEAEPKIAETLSKAKFGITQTYLNTRGATDRPTGSLSYWSSSLKILMENQKDGCSWFLNSKEFAEWRTTKNSLIWLLGDSGCGKSILSSAIIQKLQEDLGCQPIYFFFESPKSTLTNALHSLYSQIRNINMGGSASTLRAGTLRELIEKFLLTVQNAGEIWLVLDALEECNRNEWEALLIWIKEIRRQKKKNIHIVVTSLPEFDKNMTQINLLEKGDKMVFIKGQSANDITSYIHKWLKERALASGWVCHPSDLTEVSNALRERNIGRFTWATIACQLDALGLGIFPNINNIFRQLQSLPPDQHRVYGRILKNIPDRFRPQATALLHLLRYSERTLGIEEAIEFIKVTTSLPYFDLDSGNSFGSDILRYCPSLVIAVPLARSSGHQSIEIRLAHRSVKEYLAPRSSGPFTVICRTQETMAMAKNCLSYILRMDTDLPTPELSRKFPFAKYCAKYWMEFASGIEFPDEMLRGMIRDFFRSEDCYNSCYSLYRPDEDTSPEPASPLYYASFGGLLEAAEYLLMNGADPNAKGGKYGTILQAASVQGHGHIVQLLLSYRGNMGWTGTSIRTQTFADVNSEGGIYGSALQAASSKGFEKIVSTLLDHGADPNIAGGGHATALCGASAEGHAKIVRILLDYGADVEADNNAALKIARANNQIEVVEILKLYGAKDGGKSRRRTLEIGTAPVWL
ncbi:hypothetical protein EYR41_005738 [Orbilia oligospora]|uniref:Nephrocystin 3-like N-terminal domain-containing protein n=1 Tax=Orbilia oligospora TaxID=2813651 RepID=A0A8H2E312_ORBOL|nr:hypothetical protein EYR41_005738 [Orbilia oligospora]